MFRKTAPQIKVLEAAGKRGGENIWNSPPEHTAAAQAAGCGGELYRSFRHSAYPQPQVVSFRVINYLYSNVVY
jgi:hypothetical protein